MIPLPAAPCPHFDSCGGCLFQDVPPDIYRMTKMDQVTQALGAFLSNATVHEPIFIPHATRRRVSFVARFKDGVLEFGFNQKKSHAIVDVKTCLLLIPRLESLRHHLRAYLPRILSDHHSCDIFLQDVAGKVEMVITGPVRSSNGSPDTAFTTYIASMAAELGIARIGWRARGTQSIQPITVLNAITYEFAGLVVDLPYQAFLQPSVEGEAALMSKIKEFLPRKKKLRAADLFCGCGTFTGLLLENAASLYAAEGDTLAVNALRSATKGLAHVTVEQRDLEKEALTLREMKNLDVIVFDPPRAGAKSLSQRIAQSSVPVIIGVSCNPQTLARDAQTLIKGGYKLTDLVMVDQFIWSDHVEVVTRFEKSA